MVIGGKSVRDYAKLLPPHSYINVEDFDSPKDLANYLIFLGKNATEYNKYHQWRREYQGNYAFKIHQNIDEVFLASLARAWIFW